MNRRCAGCGASTDRPIFNQLLKVFLCAVCDRYAQRQAAKEKKA